MIEQKSFKQMSRLLSDDFQPKTQNGMFYYGKQCTENIPLDLCPSERCRYSMAGNKTNELFAEIIWGSLANDKSFEENNKLIGNF